MLENVVFSGVSMVSQRRKIRNRIRQRLRRDYFKKKHGITRNERDAILASQGGVCAICGSDWSGTRYYWHLDHDHDSGRIRGVLCHHCNIMVGMAREDVHVLRAAVEYLERWEATSTWKDRPVPIVGRSIGAVSPAEQLSLF